MPSGPGGTARCQARATRAVRSTTTAGDRTPSCAFPGSRTTPLLPTAPRPASNCGFISAIAQASGTHSANGAGNTRVANPMKLASHRTSAPMGSGTPLRASYSARWSFHDDDTRGPVRSFQASCPCRHRPQGPGCAPRASSTSVKPPVEAPTSSTSAPVTQPEWSSAWASLMPPRETQGSSRPRTWSSAPGSSLAGLFDLAFAGKHLAGEDQRLGLGPAFSEATVNERLVGALFNDRLGRVRRQRRRRAQGRSAMPTCRPKKCAATGCSARDRSDGR